MNYNKLHHYKIIFTMWPAMFEPILHLLAPKKRDLETNTLRTPVRKTHQAANASVRTMVPHLGKSADTADVVRLATERCVCRGVRTMSATRSSATGATLSRCLGCCLLPDAGEQCKESRSLWAHNFKVPAPTAKPRHCLSVCGKGLPTNNTPGRKSVATPQC